MADLALDSSLQNRYYDADGQLHIRRTPISKAIVNPYYGREIPGSEDLGLHPDKIYQLLRDPGELAKAAPSFAGKQLMRKHIQVNADDPKHESIAGAVGSAVEYEHPYLMADLAIWDAEAIAGIETDAVRELSSSYRYRADMTPGVYEGKPYDGLMRDIDANHVALVEEGRAGHDVMAADEKHFALDEWEESKHPRAENGEFGSSGGGGNPQSDHPFIKSFLSEHKSTGEQKKYLERVPVEKLHAALKLAGRSDSPDSKRVKKMIEAELDSRANRGTSKGFGEDSRLETKMETKFGKALYAMLSAISPKLAADAGLKPLVIGLSPKKFDSKALEPKLLAMDSALAKDATLAAMQAAKDAARDEETEEERKERERKEAEDRRAKDRKAKDGKKRAKDMSFEEWAEEEENEPEHEDKAAKDARMAARDAEEDDEDREKRREYEKKAEDAKKAMDGGFDDLVEKLEKKGYSKEYATKVAGKVAAEKRGDCSFGSKDKKAKDEEAMDRKAMDRQIKLATDSLRAEFRNIEEAKRDVRSVVGDVIAMDSAADIYTFALDQMKVDHKDVSGVANLRALFKAAKSAASPAPHVAFDGAGIEEKFPGANRSLNVL